MDMEHISREERDRLIGQFIGEMRDGDSLLLIRSMQKGVNKVESQTLTFLYPCHMTAAINVCVDLANNIRKLLIQSSGNN